MEVCGAVEENAGVIAPLELIDDGAVFDIRGAIVDVVVFVN